MITYRLRLAALPDGGGLLILNLADWQQEALESLLTDQQHQMVDEGLIRIQGRLLVEEITEELLS